MYYTEPEGRDERPDTKIESKWKGAKLVVKSKTERTEIKEEYELSPDGDKLSIKVRLKTRMLSQPVVFLRVYDRAPDEADSETDPESSDG